MPALTNIIGEVYRPKSGDEQRFFDKHVVQLFQNIYAKDEYDKLFKGTNVKAVDREKDNHGYNPGSDEKVYEEVEELDENWVFNSLMSDAHHYSNHKSRRGKHKMGHVAHAAVETAKDLNTSIHQVTHFSGVNRYGGDIRHGDDIVGGSDGLAGMTAKDASKKVKKLFAAHLKDAGKRNVTFNPNSHPELCEELADKMMELEDQFELDEAHHIDNIFDHLRAIKSVADQHGVPKSLVAGAVGHHVGSQSVIPSTIPVDRYGDSPGHFTDSFHSDYVQAKKDAQAERMEKFRGLSRPIGGPRKKSKRKLSAVAKKFLKKK